MPSPVGSDPVRPSWDEYFLAIARTVSTRSDCVRSKVGAVVVQGRRIRATGYNGAPAGEPGCASCPRRLSGVDPESSYDTGPGRCVALHAEQNALLYCDRADLLGATLYVTRRPCPGCARLIAGAGVARVVTPDDAPSEPASDLERGADAPSELAPPAASEGKGRSARCDECGRFVKAPDLRPVWGPMPDSGPDHEACTDCRPTQPTDPHPSKEQQ